MNNGDKKQEVLAPDVTDDGVKTDIKASNINLVAGKSPDNVVLTTPGMVKSEMGRIYRAVLKGRLSADLGKLLIHGHLTPILKATEIEQEFNLAMDDPEADTPALSGLTITGPDTAPQEGAPQRSLDGTNLSTTRSEKGKDNGETKGNKSGTEARTDSDDQ